MYKNMQKMVKSVAGTLFSQCWGHFYHRRGGVIVKSSRDVLKAETITSEIQNSWRTRTHTVMLWITQPVGTIPAHRCTLCSRNKWMQAPPRLLYSADTRLCWKTGRVIYTHAFTHTDAHDSCQCSETCVYSTCSICVSPWRLHVEPTGRFVAAHKDVIVQQ